MHEVAFEIESVDKALIAAAAVVPATKSHVGVVKLLLDKGASAFARATKAAAAHTSHTAAHDASGIIAIKAMLQDGYSRCLSLAGGDYYGDPSGVGWEDIHGLCY